MENLTIADLFAISTVTTEKLKWMEEYANKNNISSSSPLADKWVSLSKLNAKAKGLLIKKIQYVSANEGIDVSDCF